MKQICRFFRFMVKTSIRLALLGALTVFIVYWFDLDTALLRKVEPKVKASGSVPAK